MKQFSLLLIFCAFLLTNCKEAATLPEEATNIIKTAPFENSDFKIERASINLPAVTTKIHFFDEFNGICLTGGSIYGAGANMIESNSLVGGSIFTTNDRGLTWTESYTFSKETSNCLRPSGFEVLDNRTVVAFVGASYCVSSEVDVHTNLIIRSIDKGKTWTTTKVTNTNLRGLTRSKDNVLYALCQNSLGTVVTFDNIFLTSKDGGLAWERSQIKIPFLPLGNIFSLSTQKLLIVGDYCNFDNFQYFSVDKGLNWQFSKGGKEYVLGMSNSANIGYQLTNVSGKLIFNIHQTTDGGDNWTNIRVFTNTINEVKAVTPTTAIVLGRGNSDNNPGFSYTFDAGKTWRDIDLLDNLDVGQLITSSFYDAKNGYIVGSKKVLYKMTLKK
jgi:photosystem II stability/assembly factor-like uncharacterized protein